MLGVEGTTAFGAASLAFLRMTGGTTGAALTLVGSLVVWTILPLGIAAARLKRADL
jgi:Cu-processing system permease protein